MHGLIGEPCHSLRHRLVLSHCVSFIRIPPRRSRNVYHGLKKKRFMSHRFDSYAGMSFPDADVSHLETCIAFFLWAFSVSYRLTSVHDR